MVSPPQATNWLVISYEIVKAKITTTPQTTKWYAEYYFTRVLFAPKTDIHQCSRGVLHDYDWYWSFFSSMPWKWSYRNLLTTEKMRSDNSKTAKWEQYERDGDRYYLQYRTVGDSHFRESTLRSMELRYPCHIPFWDTHYSPNGWNCRWHHKTSSGECCHMGWFR